LPVLAMFVLLLIGWFLKNILNLLSL
jgi:hypothetical protein